MNDHANIIVRTIELLNFLKIEYISQFISICFDFNGNNRVISFLNLHFERIKLGNPSIFFLKNSTLGGGSGPGQD